MLLPKNIYDLSLIDEMAPKLTGMILYIFLLFDDEEVLSI